MCKTLTADNKPSYDKSGKRFGTDLTELMSQPLTLMAPAFDNLIICIYIVARARNMNGNP